MNYGTALRNRPVLNRPSEGMSAPHYMMIGATIKYSADGLAQYYKNHIPTRYDGPNVLRMYFASSRFGQVNLAIRC